MYIETKALTTKFAENFQLKNRFILPFLSILFILPFASVELDAQVIPESCIGGRHYMVAFPDTVTNAQDSRFPDRSPTSIALMIYSPVEQTVSISRAGGREAQIRVAGNEMIEYSDFAVLGPSIVTERNVVNSSSVVEVRATVPIVLYAYYTTPFGTAGFTPLPVEAWGREYYGASWPGEIVRDVKPKGEMNFDAEGIVEAPAQILVIASEENTRLTISPTAGLADCNDCQTVILDRGEAYLVQSFVEPVAEVERREDIAGTYIFASKPIGVISGNTRTQIDPFDFPLLAGNSPKDLTAEWITPINLHGRAFAFMPTHDELGPRKSVSRGAENVRIFPTAESKTEIIGTNRIGDRNPIGDALADPGEFENWRITDLEEGAAISTSDPAQAYQAINSWARFNGTTGSGNFIGASYKAWGSAMVELIPRERWGSFAPFRAPSIYSDMTHYARIVTDSAHAYNIYIQRANGSSRTLLIFNHVIAGTDLVWTQVSVNPGITYHVIGERGARFSGMLQGGDFSGYELFRPGSAKREEKGTGSSASHPSEYEEDVAGLYAMPLVSRACFFNPTELYRIDTLEDGCSGLTLRITRTDGGLLDFDYFRLDQQWTSNTVLEFITPSAGPRALDTAHVVVVRLRPINPGREASGLLRLRDADQAGDEVVIRANYEVPTLSVESGPVVLTDVTEPVEKVVLLKNRSERPVELRLLSLAFGDRGFTIERTEPSGPWDDPRRTVTVAPGSLLRVVLRYDPSVQRSSTDSLIIDLLCNRMTLALNGTAGAMEPCIEVDDLDFGVMDLGDVRRRSLEICNRGAGMVTFGTGSSGGDVVDWAVREFSMNVTDIERLRNAALGRDECITVEVTFTSREVMGDFRTVARFFTNTEGCRDSSIWTAQVGILSVDEELTGDRLAIRSIAPNPTSGVIRVSYRSLNQKPGTIRLVDADGREREVAVEHLGGQGDEQEAVIDATNLPSGVYFVRLGDEREEVVGRVTIVR